MVQQNVKYAVLIVTPQSYLHSLAFAEVAETIHLSLLSAGFDSLLVNDFVEGRTHIVLGANLVSRFSLSIKPGSILYNLEQVDVSSDWLNSVYLDLLSKHRVWDYSENNARKLSALGVDVEGVLPIGYVPELTRITHWKEEQKDIDVLFIGSLNQRRRDLLDELISSGLNVEELFGIYGAERDAYIARTKVMLNIHYYESKVLERVRLSYLAANRCAILSEHSANPQDDQDCGNAIRFSGMKNLADMAHELVKSVQSRKVLGDLAFEWIKQIRLDGHLRSLLTEPKVNYPRIINRERESVFSDVLSF